MFAPYITKEELSSLDNERFLGDIHLINRAKDVKAAVKVLLKEKRVGIDTETKPSFSKGERSEVSLLQVSTEKDCYLFRLHMIGGLTPDLLRLLSSPDIFKIGLSLHDDYIALRRLSPFEPEGFIELQRLCPAYGIKDASLQKIYAIMFKKRISKSQRLTNWEAANLSPNQQMYAALDAWAALRIFDQLMLLPDPHPVKFALL